MQLKIWLTRITLEYKTAWATQKAVAAAAVVAAGVAAAIAAGGVEGEGGIGGGQLVLNAPQGAMIPVPGGILAEVVKPENVVTCPKGTDCDHVILQGDIFISEQLAEVVKQCRQERRNIKTVFVNVRDQKTQPELCSVVALIKQCASEKAFTGVVLLPDGTPGDSMKTPLVNMLKEFGKVTCIAVVKTSPMEITCAQETPFAGGHGQRTFTSTVISVIQWAVVVRFDDGGDRLLVPKGTFDLLMFPPLSPQLRFKFQQVSMSSNSVETAIVDTEQLNPSLLAYFW